MFLGFYTPVSDLAGVKPAGGTTMMDMLAAGEIMVWVFVILMMIVSWRFITSTDTK